jgi:hypothetical protein
MNQYDLLLLLTIIMTLIVFSTALVPVVIEWNRSREEYKVWKIMKQELGTSPTPEQFHAFIEKHPKFHSAMYRISVKMEMASLAKDLMQSLRDLLKKMQEDMDE